MTAQTFIPGKDAALEDSIAKFQQKLTALGFNIEEASWLNPVPNVWSAVFFQRQRRKQKSGAGLGAWRIF